MPPSNSMTLGCFLHLKPNCEINSESALKVACRRLMLLPITSVQPPRHFQERQNRGHFSFWRLAVVLYHASRYIQIRMVSCRFDRCHAVCQIITYKIACPFDISRRPTISFWISDRVARRNLFYQASKKSPRHFPGKFHPSRSSPIKTSKFLAQILQNLDFRWMEINRVQISHLNADLRDTLSDLCHPPVKVVTRTRSFANNSFLNSPSRSSICPSVGRTKISGSITSSRTNHLPLALLKVLTPNSRRETDMHPIYLSPKTHLLSKDVVISCTVTKAMLDQHHFPWRDAIHIARIWGVAWRGIHPPTAIWGNNRSNTLAVPRHPPS